MGVCFSNDKRLDPLTRDRLDVARSKSGRLFAASPAQSLKEMSALSAADAVSPGSQEDIFFESRGWLDSDCEDEFFSVNGGSCGSTPNHPRSASLTPRSLDNEFFCMKFPYSKSEHTTRTKTLADFLRESLQSELAEHASDAAEDGAGLMFEPVIHPINSEPKSLDITPYLSEGSSSSATGDAMTPNSVLIIPREKARKTGACCLPFVHTKMSPKSCPV